MRVFSRLAAGITAAAAGVALAIGAVGGGGSIRAC